MSRPSFFSRPSSHDRDASPLLPQHRNSVSLCDLSPRSSRSSGNVLPSPPPSFYRDANTTSPSQHNNEVDKQAQSLSPSPSRTKQPRRKIQFMAPPPPIASSMLLPTHHVQAGTSPTAQPKLGSHIVRRGNTHDPLIGLERREMAIQQDLQLLLDAQSTGLVQGFGGGGEQGSDNGSNTPTSRSMVMGGRSSSRGGSQGQSGGKAGIIPVRQPKHRTIGLRGARRGLLRQMAELVGIKGEEMSILDKEIQTRHEVLAKVYTWEKRIETVKGQLSGATMSNEEGAEEEREIFELQNEERAVDNEIREMADRLAAMQARKRWLAERVTEEVNKREARLSSFRGALREAEGEVKDFLKRPPIPISTVMGEVESFTALPASRRTLPMAKEWFSKELSQLQSRQQEVEKEKEALEEGAKLWGDSIAVVVEFEDELRKQMTSKDLHGPEVLAAQIEKMEVVIEKLENKAKMAELKGWNLLICAVGAELAAFKEGESILRSALGVAFPEHHPEGKGIETAADLLSERNLETDESEDDGPYLAQLLVDSGGRDGPDGVD